MNDKWNLENVIDKITVILKEPIYARGGFPKNPKETLRKGVSKFENEINLLRKLKHPNISYL